MQLTETRRSILLILVCMAIGVSIGICAIIWLHTPPAKAYQLRPLIKEIETYNANNGEYPTSCTNFSSFTKISKQFRIYSGRGIIDAEIENYDFTILVNPEGYEIFLPATVSDRLSLNFVAWRFDSGSHHWRKGRIRAPLWGSNWGINWKPSFP